MKLNKLFFLSSLFTGLSLVQAHAQNNVVLGYKPGTDGINNTHIGTFSGKGGSDNTALGYRSGSNNTGSFNIFIGYQSGLFNSSGLENTFVGSDAGEKNTTGNYNVFMGSSSGRLNSYGYHNAFFGVSSGFENYSGNYNTFLGNFSGYKNTYGGYNTFVGSNSGYSNTSGKRNVFLGNYSGYKNYWGDNNVFIGYKAGYNEKSSNKLYIANTDDENPLLYGDFDNNILSIGSKYAGLYYTLVVPGHVRATKYDVVSDERLKEQVKSLNNVLAKVQQVKGVSYVLKEEAITRQVAGSRQKADKAVQYGFLAQNIREVFPELVTEDGGTLAVNYQGMIPVLVEAIKTLTAQKDSVVAANFTMAQQITAMHQRLDALETAVREQKPTSLGNAANYRLEQNHPNPFNQNTTIRYQVSKEAQPLRLLITNEQGVEVQRFDQLPAGAGEVQIKAGSLAPGMYVYSLFADGRLISAKRMILTR